MGKSLKRGEKFFETEVKRFIDYFGLKNWEIDIFSIIDDDFRACCLASEESDGSLSGRMASIMCSLEWVKDSNTTLEEISRSAFHEVMELILMPLRNYAQRSGKFIASDAVDSEIHNIIRTFENTIYKDFLKPNIRNNNGDKRNKKTNS